MNWDHWHIGTDIQNNSKAQISILYPEKNFVTTNDILKIKGINRYLGKIMINGDLINTRPDGRFYHELIN